MNKTRRKEINRAYSLIYEVNEILERVAEEEREYLDTLPENLQGGEKAHRAEAAADALDEAVSSLEEVLSSCETAIE